jgi:nitrate/nitrite transport system substrate-binding protein
MAKEPRLLEDQDRRDLQKQASRHLATPLNNQIDGVDCPSACSRWLPTAAWRATLKIAMVPNNNGQAITLGRTMPPRATATSRRRKVLAAKTPTMAMTFPGGTHDMWLRYWLRATKVDPSAVKIIPIPPPQMVANMSVGTMDGYSVGEPWNAVAVDQNIGFTAIASQDIWTNHPEKALVVSECLRPRSRTCSKT